MKVLLHARSPELIAVCRDRFLKLGLNFDIAEDLEKGLALMKSQTYQKIFIGYGVSSVDRLAIIAAASECRCGITEILDRDTIYKVLRVRSLSTSVRIN